MLSHIGGRATVLSAQRQALQQAQDDEDDGRCHPDGGVVGQDADNEGRDPHDQNGHQKGVLAPDHVTQAAKEQGPEGADDEAGGKRQQRKDEGRRRIQPGKELPGNDGCQRPVQIEVVPLEHAEHDDGDPVGLLLGSFTDVAASGQGQRAGRQGGQGQREAGGVLHNTSHLVTSLSRSSVMASNLLLAMYT